MGQNRTNGVLDLGFTMWYNGITEAGAVGSPATTQKERTGMVIDIRGISSARDLKAIVRKAYEDANADTQNFDAEYDSWVEHYHSIGAAQGPARQPHLQAEREAAATMLGLLMKP